MSLGIAFKSSEGIVLAADSRVTLTGQIPQPGQGPLLIPATYDNATKLLRVRGQDHVGAVTYGLGALGGMSPRTAHSFMPEFEARLLAKKSGRLSVEQFAQELGDFFMEQWKAFNAGSVSAVPQPMVFLVGGFDKDAAYGRVFELFIPNTPKPREQYVNPGEFGIVYGGQREYADRLLNGYDERMLDVIKAKFNLSEQARGELKGLLQQFGTPIPYPFLPLQDCIDLAIYVIRSTIALQSWLIGIRGVGGDIDVAVITRDGTVEIQRKKLRGETPEIGV